MVKRQFSIEPKLQRVIDLDPSYKVARVNLCACLARWARSLEEKGELTEAVNKLEHALQFLPDVDNTRAITTLNLYAFTLRKLNRIDEAKAAEARSAKFSAGRSKP